MSLPSEFVMPDPVIELAFGADLAASPLSWEWTDVTGDLLAQTLNVQRGSADEAAQTQPMTVGFELSNLDGDYTPGLATSQYYPNVVRGTPCRVRLSGGSTDTYLALDGRNGTSASTPDTAALDITGDMAAWFDGDIDWGRAGSTILVNKYKAEGDQRSYALYLSQESIPVLVWSTDGTQGGWGFGFTEAPLPWSKGRHAVAATLDADNGAGGFTVTFYVADTAAGPWTVFETYVDSTGTTSIFSGTAPLEVGGDFEGDVPEFNSPHPPAGKVYSAGVDNAATLPAASPVANPDFSAQAAGTTSFSDGLVTWTLNGDAVITDLDRVRFVGHVDEITPEWPYGDLSDGDLDSIPGEARVTITASGALRRMQQGAKPFDSPIRRRVMGATIEGVPQADAITAYWPLEDGSDAKSFASPTPGVSPMSFSNMTPAGDDTLAASLTAASVAANTAAAFSATVPNNGQADEWMVSFFVKMPVGTVGDTLLMQVVTYGGTVRTWRILVSTTAFTVKGYDVNDTEIVNAAAGGGPVGFFGDWVQVNLRAVQNGGNIDWEATWLTLDAFVGGVSASEPGTNAPVKLLQWLVSSSGAGGMSYAHIIASYGIGAGFLGWTDGANQAYLGERAGIRILRLCREEGIDCHVVGSAYFDNAALGVQGTETLPDLLREAAEADGGRLYENRERPGLVYRTRASLYNQTAALELDAGTSEIAPPFVPTLDDQRLRNDVTVKRDGGTSYRATTDPEPAPGDRYDEEVTLSLAADDQVRDQAGWRLHLGTWPGMRYRQLATELSIVRPATLAAWLALDIGDRIHVDNLPPQHPSDTVDLLAEGYAERLSVSRWSPELTCSPGGPWTVGVRDDDELGRRDTAGTELADDMTALDTTSIIVVTSGTEWTQEPADYPFDLDIGGERVTATELQELFGDLVFTVERSVNGVEKAHTTGTPVRLWQPAIRAL